MMSVFYHLNSSVILTLILVLSFAEDVFSEILPIDSLSQISVNQPNLFDLDDTIFDSSLLPVKIIFVDDKLSQVESVDTALTKLGIPHQCYVYLATDKKAKAFDPLITNSTLLFC